MNFKPRYCMKWFSSMLRPLKVESVPRTLEILDWTWCWRRNTPRFFVLFAAKMMIFWVVIPCTLVDGCQYHLRLQGDQTSPQPRISRSTRISLTLPVWEPWLSNTFSLIYSSSLNSLTLSSRDDSVHSGPVKCKRQGNKRGLAFFSYWLLLR